MEAVDSNYPYQPREEDKAGYGIDFGLLSADKGVIEGGSGRRLNYRLSPAEIIIEDREADFFLKAKFDVEARTLSFDLLTKKKGFVRTKRHPDMFAAEFVAFAHQYFTRTHKGRPPLHYRTFWLPGTDNYRQWLEARRSGLEGEEAARQTWTGRQAARLGFNIVSEVKITGFNDKPKAINCRFSRGK